MSSTGSLPKVSILIPVYNRETYIGECIQSALDQTYTDTEIVIVDNASTDRTWEICSRYAVRDERIRLFRNDANIGPVRNWLACLSHARGNYVKILFSDDLVFPHFIEHTLPLLADPEIAFVATAARIGLTPQGANPAYILPEMTRRLPSSRYFDLLLDARVPYSPGAALFRAADVRDNLQLSFPVAIPRDFARNGAGPDVLLYALTALKYPCVALLPEPGVFFRTHAGSFTIADSGNAVTQGYWAALSWFCIAKLNRRHWRYYVARTWLQRIRKTRSWVPLSGHSREYEGNGSMSESAILFAAAIPHAIAALVRRIRS